MSRHRDVRCMNYSDEYDGYDDVYGHSVEDDYCVSPGAEQFMFNRNKQSNIASFFTEPDIVEDNENEEAEEISSSYKLPNLSELDTAKLMSCVETVKNVIGDTYPESELNKKIIEFNYNTEAVLNSVLNDEASKGTKDKQPKEKSFVETQSDSKTENPFISSSNQSNLNQMDVNFSEKQNLKSTNKKSNCSQEFASLSDMISKTAKQSKVETNSSTFNSIADLTAHHLKISEKKPNSPSGFTIPKMNFNSSKPLTTISSETPTFNSLADLTAHHLKISTKTTNDKSIGSPSSFVIPQINSKDSTDGLTSTHLKISNKNKNDSKNINDCDKKPSFSTLAELSAHHLNLKKNFDTSSNVVTPKLSIKIKKEKGLNEDNSQDIPISVLEDISNLNFEEKPDINKIIKTEIEICDPMLKISIKKEKLENLDCKGTRCDNQSHKLLESTIAKIRKECLLSNENLNHKLTQNTASLFGKVLSKRYYRHMPYKRKPIRKIKEESSIIRFDFSSPSPDSIVLSRLRYRNPPEK